MSREQFIVSTKDIWQGRWSDPVTFEFNGFDTSIFIDDDERVYVQGAWATGQKEQPHTLIYQLELELETGKILSPGRYIWGGHSNYDTEGPHVYKRDGWYYMIAAEGGTFEHHMLTICRSRDIWGPYETYESNPILTADGVQSAIQGLGHGELFQDSGGEWWVVALGFRSLDGVWPLGREPFLSKVDWPEGGWPLIEQPKLLFEAQKVRETALLPHIEPVSELVYLRGCDTNNYRLSHVDGSGENYLRPSRYTLNSLKGSPTFIGRRQRELSSTASVTLDLKKSAPSGQHVAAGLAVYLDPVRYVSLAFDFATSMVTFKTLLPAPETSKEVSYAIDCQETTSLVFKVEATAKSYSFSFEQVSDSKPTGKHRQEAGSVNTSELFVRFFTGPIFGLFTQAEAPVAGSWVVLRDFQTTAIDPKGLSKPRI